MSGFRLEGELFPEQEPQAVLGQRNFVSSSLSFFPDSPKKLAPDSTSLEGLLAAGDLEACLPAGSALLRSFSFQGVHFREPICPTHWSAQEFQVQGFLPLGNVLLTYLLSNSPIGSGKPLLLPTFPASETSISSPIHLT